MWIKQFHVIEKQHLITKHTFLFRVFIQRWLRSLICHQLIPQTPFVQIMIHVAHFHEHWQCWDNRQNRDQELPRGCQSMASEPAHAQHCSKPAISERARDSTASRQAQKNEEGFLKGLFQMGKGMNAISTHIVYWREENEFTYNEERSHDTQLYWVLSQETCGSFWSQIPFCQWTRSWRKISFHTINHLSHDTWAIFSEPKIIFFIFRERVLLPGPKTSLPSVRKDED